MNRCLLTSLAVAIVALAPSLEAQTGNIDPNERHAWAENAGWLDFRPVFGGVTVLPTHLTGYAWHEGTGWVKLGSNAGGPYGNTSATNWGVNLNAGTGALSGFAWSENAGWIRMDPAFGGVTYDGPTKKLSGWAWSEGYGWIHFRSTTPTAYGVALTCGSLTGTVTGGGNVCGVGSSGVTVTVGGGAAPYTVTLDNGGGTQSGAGPAFIFTVSPASTTTYSVASLADGFSCVGAGSGSATVTVNAIPATPTAGSNSPVCTGSTITLTTPTVTGATYAWTGPNGFASALQNPTISNATAAGAGTYSVRVIVNGCTSTAGTTAVVVQARPARPTITAPTTVLPNQAFTASVPEVAGVSYGWSVTNGTVTGGEGTRSISVTAGETGPVLVSIVETSVATGCGSEEASVTIPVGSPATGFFTLVPCRLFDSRQDSGAAFAAPALAPGELRTLSVEARCGIDSTSVRSLSVNLTVTQPAADGELVVYRGDLLAEPVTSNISFKAGKTRANNGLVELSLQDDGTIKIRNRSAGSVHFILDVNGTFE